MTTRPNTNAPGYFDEQAAAARAMVIALQSALVYLGDDYTDDSDEARSTRAIVNSALNGAAAAGIKAE